MKKLFQIKPDPIPMTRTGYEQMKQDLEKTLLYRGEVLVRLQAAREMGDLSENGAYTAARQELGATDRKLRHLKLLDLYGVPTDPRTDGVVGFGSKVTIKDHERTITYLLVTEHESNPSENKLSMTSPVGKALLGKMRGDQILVSLPSGEKHVTIDKVQY
jgi:transcription elongation factor GreA